MRGCVRGFDIRRLPTTRTNGYPQLKFCFSTGAVYLSWSPVGRSPVKTHYYDLVIRVLIYKRDDEFVAHALEMDIPASGATEEAAKKELENLVENQLSFAASK